MFVHFVDNQAERFADLRVGTAGWSRRGAEGEEAELLKTVERLEVFIAICLRILESLRVVNIK